MSLGEYIKSIRHRRGLSQWELSRLSGLTRSHLSRLELNDIEDPSAETFISLARALKIHPNDLYQAAGYIEENARFRRTLDKTPEEAFEELEKLTLHPVPVLEKIQSKASEIVQYSQWGLSHGEQSKVVGLLARGFCLEPEIKEGDLIFIQPEQRPVPGNVVLCYQDEKVQLARFGSQNGGNVPSEGGFHIYGVVIGINRKIG
ncbi:MAG TPA: LexA family transcriptional regulator [Dehalococcoidales bacterium]|nr:LexA family transcriptional regulator [Dehalococcoidales bacterium]